MLVIAVVVVCCPGQSPLITGLVGRCRLGFRQIRVDIDMLPDITVVCFLRFRANEITALACWSLHTVTNTGLTLPGGIVALSVEYRTCDREVVGSSLGQARVNCCLRRNPGQVSHTYVPLFTKQYKLVPAKGR